MADYNSHTVPQLKEILKERGLSTDGKKADLVARLTESDSTGTNGSTGVDTTNGDKPDAEPQPETTEPSGQSEPKGESEPSQQPEKSANTDDGEAGSSETAAVEDNKPKVLSPEERKQLAVDLLNKKIQRAEKFGDEASAEAARKDLARVEKFGVEPGTALAREIGLVDKSFNNGLREKLFKKNFKRNFHKKQNFKPKFNKFHHRKY